MHSCTRMLRGVAVLALVAYLQSFVLPSLVRAQASECNYDKANPSIDSARLNFRITNYDCAEEELQALLADETLDLQTRADAHVLLAAVYYAEVRNDDEKKQRVLEQFVAAFKSLREWRGELDIKSPEFVALMNQAQQLVDERNETAETLAEEVPEARVDLPADMQSDGKKKPWYKKWWAIGLGVGLVATAVVVAAGGSDDGGSSGNGGYSDLPGFPPLPGE